MNLSDQVIKDLIVLYQAGEASEDTVALVEECLKERPELAKWMEESIALDEVPPLAEDNQMKSFRAIRRKWGGRIAIAVLVLTALLTALLTFADFS